MISEAKLLEITSLLSLGMSDRKIAAKAGVGRSTVAAIRSGDWHQRPNVSRRLHETHEESSRAGRSVIERARQALVAAGREKAGCI